MRRLVPLLLILATGGCAYFNGIYNARSAERAADRAARAGQEAAAASSFALVAATAETVLVRHGRSKWRSEALYLAGRGLAFSGQCDPAMQRLQEYLSLNDVPPRKRQRATVAMGRCLVHRSKHGEALALLHPLASASDRDVAATASLWAARASMGLGLNEDAVAYLATADAASAQWEVIRASLRSMEYARAESLLVGRAQRSDYRDELIPAITELWRAGREANVQRIVHQYGEGRLPGRTKASLYISLARLMLDAERDSLARQTLIASRRFSTDTLLDRQAGGLLALLSLRDVQEVAEAEAIVRRAAAEAPGPLPKALQSHLELLKFLLAVTDYTGASQFLAAEVARDSLRAPRLAHTLFTRLVTTMNSSPMAPKALLAAAAVLPESTAVYRSRVLEKYPESAFAYVLRGDDPAHLKAYERTDVLLMRAWTAAVDSMRVRRQAEAGQPATASTPP